MTLADQLLDNLASGVYDDVLGDTFTFMEFLKVNHPAEYKARMERKCESSICGTPCVTPSSDSESGDDWNS